MSAGAVRSRPVRTEGGGNHHYYTAVEKILAETPTAVEGEVPATVGAGR